MVFPRAGLNWTTKVAYAIQDANTLIFRPDDVWLAYAKAHSVAEMQQAMKKLGYMPWVNTIAADRNGAAMYADVSVIPDVSTEQLMRCAPSKPAAALFIMAGLPVLTVRKASATGSVIRLPSNRGSSPLNACLYLNAATGFKTVMTAIGFRIRLINGVTFLPWWG